ncbi:MAG: thioredoxin domain-containing protein [Chlamydiales bacterium]|nr:thioredoxin domain-containing protein [Chlamydiales bacterium]
MKTLFLTLVMLFSACFVHSNELFPDVSNQPTIGNLDSKVHVVAFLEPKCPDSKRYNNESFFKLKKEFIDTDKIRYTVIITSFLFKSTVAAEALLCVYHQDAKPRADLFFKYLDYIYQNQLPERKDWATLSMLLTYASHASSEINLPELKKCVESEHYLREVKENTAIGNQLMGHISTPTIFVNGVRVENKNDTIDYTNLKDAIDFLHN